MFLFGDRRQFPRVFSGFYRGRYIVGLVIEAYYRKVFIIPCPIERD